MQSSDRGFGKVKSLLKSSVRDYWTAVYYKLLSPVIQLLFLVGSLWVSVLACLARPLCPLPPASGCDPGASDRNSGTVGQIILSLLLVAASLRLIFFWHSDHV